MYRLLTVIVMLWFVPFYIANAAVYINEIAWMGGADSANDEWIELYNDGNSQSVEGWSLSDGQALDIELTGSVAAGQYAVLERTDEDSAPGNSFLIYTGSLGNDGRTLTLKRSDGTIVDQVVGGENWSQVGGDNTTKETAQYTSSGWITAEGTPGFNNKTEESDEKVEDDDSDALDENEKDPVHISLNIPDTELFLDIDSVSQAQVNSPIYLEAVASGISSKHIDSLWYDWNFGDLQTGSGKTTSVTYSHPGTYVIVVEASCVRHKARARHEIVVLPATISLEKGPTGELLIHNDARYEMDISGYRLQGVEEIIFPEMSYLAPGATLSVDAKNLGSQKEQMVAIYDTAENLVASLLPEKILPVERSIDSVVTSQVVEDSPLSVKPPSRISAISTTKEEYEDISDVTPGNLAAASQSGIPPEKLPYLGLMGVMLVGILALYAKGPKEG